MEEEKKYNEGQVTISSTEYRDLITELAETKHDVQKRADDYWKERDRANNANKQADQLKKQNELFKQFISNNNLESAFGCFKVSQEAKETDED